MSYFYNPRFDGSSQYYCDSFSRTYDRAYGEGFSDGKKQGIVDTIDELIKELDDVMHYASSENPTLVVNWDDIENIAKKLKENNNNE